MAQPFVSAPDISLEVDACLHPLFV